MKKRIALKIVINRVNIRVMALRGITASKNPPIVKNTNAVNRNFPLSCIFLSSDLIDLLLKMIPVIIVNRIA